MIGYHVTTKKKMERYKRTGSILPPVRFWAYKSSAEAWKKRASRDMILKIEVETAYPLPDHKPAGHAFWSPEVVREWSTLCDMQCEDETTFKE